VKLLGEFEQLRARSGRPHWILVDDAERLLPASAPQESLPLPARLDRMALITETPTRLSRRALQQIDTVAIVGARPQDLLTELCKSVGRVVPAISDAPLATGEALYWRLDDTSGPVRLRVAPPRETSVIEAGKQNTARQPPSHPLATLAR
jgi:hypothetical protein